MIKFRKVLAGLLAGCMIAGALAGCESASSAGKETKAATEAAKGTEAAEKTEAGKAETEAAEKTEAGKAEAGETEAADKTEAGKTDTEAEDKTKDQTADAADKAGTDTGDLEVSKIGFIGWGFTDLLGSSYQAYYDYIADDFGIEFSMAAGSTNEEHISLTENLIQKGVQGLLAYNVTSKMMDMCDAAGVYLMQFGSPVTDEELKAYLETSPYWLGCSTVDDYAAGQAMVEALYNAGSRNIAAIAPAAGNPCHDLRWNGIFDKAEEYDDMQVIGEFRSANTADYTGAVQNFISMYPELDGVVATGASSGGAEAIIQAIDTEGKTEEVKFATLDIIDGTADYMNEGALEFIGGGQFPEVVFLAIYMNDVIKGNTKPAGAIQLDSQFIYIQGAEGYANYAKYIGGDVFPYTVDELKQVSSTFNKDASFEDLYNTWKNYNLEDVMKRHADLIK